MEAGRERMNRYPSIAPSSVDIHVVASRCWEFNWQHSQATPAYAVWFYFTVFCNACFTMRSTSSLRKWFCIDFCSMSYRQSIYDPHRLIIECNYIQWIYISVLEHTDSASYIFINFMFFFIIELRGKYSPSRFLLIGLHGASIEIKINKALVAYSLWFISHFISLVKIYIYLNLFK